MDAVADTVHIIAENIFVIDMKRGGHGERRKIIALHVAIGQVVHGIGILLLLDFVNALIVKM